MKAPRKSPRQRQGTHGASWADIGRYAGMDAQATEERFAPELTRWSEELEVPQLFDEGGRGRVLRLPYAVYAPHIVSRDLDLWAHLHLTTRDLHAVSAGLRMAGPAKRVTYPETESDERGDIVRVTVTGAALADPRLRIGTLFDAFSR